MRKTVLFIALLQIVSGYVAAQVNNRPVTANGYQAAAPDRTQDGNASQNPSAQNNYQPAQQSYGYGNYGQAATQPSRESTYDYTGSAGTMTDSEAAAYILRAQRQGKTRAQIVSELVSLGISPEKARALFMRPESAMTDEAGSRLRSPVIEDRQATLRNRPYPQARRIFGHEIFNTTSLTFEPAMNIATPPDYRLGPGDEVIIDMWGDNQVSLRGTVSPDGTVFVSGIGPVQLNGLTVEEANKTLRHKFAGAFMGVDTGGGNISLTLGQIRTIQINVMGEVLVPGTYTLSSFATVFYALYRSGGINDIGSLRNISVVRNGKRVAVIDIYEYILGGQHSDFVRLEDGDVILVPPYDRLVEIEGNVKRPMYYEMKEGETLSTLIDFSGGFTGDAYSRSLTIARFDGTQQQVFNVDSDRFATFALHDGDRIKAGAALDRFANRVEIEGAVLRPGAYDIGEQLSTVGQLIARAEGLREDAFLNRAVLTRRRNDLTPEVLQIDLRGIIGGTSADIPLRKHDILYIPGVFDLMEDRTLSIKGAVANPGDYPYAENTTIEDLIVQAGGLLESASTAKVEVARRIKDPGSQYESNEISRIFTFPLTDGLAIENGGGFALEPFDVVYVRVSPTYYKQRNVRISGEVLFEGVYPLGSKNERLSDLVTKAGGVTSDAYVRGARIERSMNEDERKILETAIRMASRGGRDSISMETIDTATIYTVGIELDKALARPGSDYDMVLREGDRLIIPELVSTVKINGAVLHNNTVLYTPGKGINFYINQGGGFATNARRNKVFVMYLNGTVSRYKGTRSIEPGCEIFVPSKAERRRLSLSEVLGLATSATSLATMGVAISNATK